MTLGSFGRDRLLYTQGYFSQHITEDGWQEARYIRLKFEECLLFQLLMRKVSRSWCLSSSPGRTVVCSDLWEIHVGRVPLYLLDS